MTLASFLGEWHLLLPMCAHSKYGLAQTSPVLVPTRTCPEGVWIIGLFLNSEILPLTRDSPWRFVVVSAFSQSQCGPCFFLGIWVPLRVSFADIPHYMLSGLSSILRPWSLVPLQQVKRTARASDAWAGSDNHEYYSLFSK